MLIFLVLFLFEGRSSNLQLQFVYDRKTFLCVFRELIKVMGATFFDVLELFEDLLGSDAIQFGNIFTGFVEFLSISWYKVGLELETVIFLVVQLF